MLRTLALALVATLASQQAFAQADLLAAPTQFDERYTDRVPVGGRNLVGVVATPTPAPVAGVGLSQGGVTLPGSVTGEVCVRAQTQDGRYEAANTFVSEKATPARHKLGWSIRYKDKLDLVPLQQLATLATLGPCDAKNADVVPTGLAEGGRYLRVLVNTRGAVTWAVLRNIGSDGPASGRALGRAQCVRLPEGGRVAFDSACVLGPVPADGRVSLGLEQEGRDGLSLEVVATVTLLLGAAAP